MSTDVSFEEWFAVPERVVALMRLGIIKHASPLTNLISPSPLVNSIVGGLAGAGIGYGAGSIIEAVSPEGSLERGKLRRNLTGLGAGLGILPGVYHASVSARRPDAPSGLGVLTDPWPFVPSPEFKPAPTLEPTPFLHMKQPAPLPATAVRKGPSVSINDMTDPKMYLPPSESLSFSGIVSPERQDKTKAAAASTGLMFLPTIPVDAFNEAIWADVRRPQNPYGTKNPWGTNEQSLSTPPPIAAAASGIIAGAGAASGASHVSPWEVGLAAAATAGKGYLAGFGLGKVFGALAGLTPEAQSTLRRTGAWGGLVTGAVRSLFQ